jgi:predicted homoserine dehydrogenase-like protein
LIYSKLFQRAEKKEVSAALIGAGHFGTAVVTQAFHTPFFKVPVVIDRNLEAAKNAFRHAGVGEDDIIHCRTRSQVLEALERGKWVVADSLSIIMDSPVDVIIEGTGSPEAGAANAMAAIRHGKHVAMINKETDSVVGPILHRKAKEAGLVYTPVEGDQHGLLMGLVSWAHAIGLRVISAGKARDVEYIFRPKEGEVVCEADGVALKDTYRIRIPEAERYLFGFIEPGQVRYFTSKRRELLSEIPRVQPFDMCEMTIVANATGIPIDTPELHNPIVRIAEIPQVLSLQETGDGLLTGPALDVVTCLREENEPGLGGGVFIVVSCDSDYSREILINKGLLANRERNSALIYRPYHLCGVETAISVLCAGLLGLSTGSDEYLPRYDMIRIADRDLEAGEVIGDDHDLRFRSAIVTAVKLAEQGPVPAHFLNGLKLKRAVSKDTVITFEHVDIPRDSVLWHLRSEQDRVLANHG